MNHCIVSIARAAVVGIVVAAAPLAHGQDPDLLAFNAQGPGQAQLGTNLTVNALVLSLGGALPNEDITLEILISEDTTIDGSDLVIGTKDVNVVGSFTVVCFLPESVATGPYNFALRVLPVTGETNLTNNEVLGSQVNIFDTDLCIVDTPPTLNVAATVDGPNPDPVTVLVGNCAPTSAGILVFTIFELTPAPWLDVTPSAGFVIAGFEPQPVSLLFNTAGLPTGVYSTTLQFVNFGDPGDTEFVTVNLSVDDVTVRPGDLILGTIAEGGESDEAVIEGVEGMKLKLRINAQTGNLRPKVSIIDKVTGTVIRSWVLKHKSKPIKKSTKLPATAVYTIRVEGDGGTVGAYEIATSMKLPPTAVKFKTKVKPDTGTSAGTVELLGLPGGDLDFKVKPKSFTGPLTLTFQRPTGGGLDISANTQAQQDGSTLVSDVPLDDLGTYTIGLDGFAADAEKVKITVTPTQPTGNAAVILP